MSTCFLARFDFDLAFALSQQPPKKKKRDGRGRARASETPYVLDYFCGVITYN
jgi:hypothetical protein